MCHDTMGSGPADVAASLELCECAAKIALGPGYCMSEEDVQSLPPRTQQMLQAWEKGTLRQNGSLVMKILEGVQLRVPVGSAFCGQFIAAQASSPGLKSCTFEGQSVATRQGKTYRRS